MGHSSANGNGSYDAIVVGARCAGSPTAMLLARKGYRVLVVDRATFPSDTISTHLVHPPGIAALERWGLLDALVATGCPPIDTYSMDFGPFTIAGSPGTSEFPVGYCPRRVVLDNLLVEAAWVAGAEIREGFSVEELTFDEGRVTGIRGRNKDGRTIQESAGVVIGADGRHSVIAKHVGPEQYNEKAEFLAGYYSYFSGMPVSGFEIFDRGNRGFAAMPTHDDLTLVVGFWPYAEFEANRKDVEGNYFKMFDLAPDFAERIRAAKREERIVGAAVVNYFRKPFGPGWALVGDAGYNKDPVTAQGITDAFRDAELCSAAVDQVQSGARPYEGAMGEYQSARDEYVMPMFDFTCQMASFEAPPPEMQELLGAVYGNQSAMDQFVQVFSGVISPAQFFRPIMSPEFWRLLNNPHRDRPHLRLHLGSQAPYRHLDVFRGVTSSDGDQAPSP
jgi:2-polyprenyl-6-methoxyphenol hydroxylase-like FAD-dependent oxidoreductase